MACNQHRVALVALPPGRGVSRQGQTRIDATGSPSLMASSLVLAIAALRRCPTDVMKKPDDTTLISSRDAAS